jgi:hypothetical protein
MFNNELWQKPTAAGATDFYTHQIPNSVRMVAPSSTSSSNARLTQTFSTVDSNVHWTLNFWIKRSAIEGNNPVSSARPLTIFTPRSGTSGSVLHEFQFGATGSYGAGDAFAITNTNSGTYILSTNNLFRDTSAWYNIHIQADLDNGTASEKLKIFINGTEASYNVDNRSSYSSMAGIVAGAWTIGDYYNYGYPIQSYLAQWAYVDGSTLAPTVFAEEKNGVWIPKDLSSGITWGSAGHLLMFQDSSALGDDTSGEGNDWASSNLSTHDQMLDSPTFGSSNGGNFATLGPLWKTPDMTFSEGNLQATTSTNNRGVMSNWEVPDGDKWYWEIYANSIVTSPPSQWLVGINYATVDFTSDRGGRATGVSYDSYDGKKRVDNNTSSSYGSSWATGDIIGVAVDRVNDTIQFYKNGSGQGTIDISGIDNTEFFPWAGSGGSTSTQELTFNFGQDGTFAGSTTAGGNSDDTGYGNFKYSVPSGFKAMCSGNLPVADEVDPAQTDDNYPQKLFSPLIWTGNDATSRAITGLGFRPDWLWFKNRSSAYSNRLYDTSRGIASNGGKRLFSNTNAAETDQTSGQDISAVGSDGFTMGASSGLYNNDTGSGGLQVGWFWRANGGTTSSGSGDLTSTHQVDPSGGFSIVLATGDGGSGDKTVSHGLSATPTVILAKKRSGASNWDTYFSEGVTAGSGMRFNTDEAPLTGRWGTINSSIMTCKDNYTWYSTDTFVYYCFTNIEGYIKAGTYVGNANADGTFVYTGFKPAFFMCKPIVTGNWRIQDIKRSPYNVADETLFPNHSNAEQSNSSDSIDILSNGVKMRASDSDYNQATTFVYLAMAHNPFKYATAR